MSKLAIDTRGARLYRVRMRRAEAIIRDADMIKLYRFGYSCEEIGQLHGLSRQRVHVLLVRAGVTMRDTHGREKATA